MGLRFGFIRFDFIRLVLIFRCGVIYFIFLGFGVIMCNIEIIISI